MRHDGDLGVVRVGEEDGLLAPPAAAHRHPAAPRRLLDRRVHLQTRARISVKAAPTFGMVFAAQLR